MDAFNRKFTPLSGISDPYVTVSVANAVIARTFVINNSENPVWEQCFYVPVAHYTTEVLFVVKDSDVVGLN
ncbi:putative phospholipase D [Helianthus annuus]|nr:putative phospholipase D [Helianthus annuus]